MKNSILIFCFVLASSFAMAQHVKEYQISFENISDMDVKNIVHALDPLFEAHATLAQGFQSMNYVSNKTVTLIQVQEALAPFSVNMVEFSIKEDE